MEVEKSIERIGFYLILSLVFGCGRGGEFGAEDPSNFPREELKHYAPVVESFYKNGAKSTGSGICLGKNIVATNYHVVYPYEDDGLSRVEVINFDRKRTKVSSISVNSAEFDIVLMKTQDDICRGSVYVDKNTNVTPGIELYHFGNPGGAYFAMIEGRAEKTGELRKMDSSLRKKINWVTGQSEIIVSNITAASGSSGGGVFLASNNYLVGIHFAGERSGGVEASRSIHISSHHLIDIYDKAEYIDINELENMKNQCISIPTSESETILFPLKIKGKSSAIEKNANLWSNEWISFIAGKVSRFFYFSDIDNSKYTIFYASDLNSDGIIDGYLGETLHQEKDSISDTSLSGVSEYLIYADTDGDNLLDFYYSK